MTDDKLVLELAALLMARDDTEGHLQIDQASILWFRHFIQTHKDGIHDGDCTKMPYSCARCNSEAVLKHAKQILDLLERCKVEGD